MSKGEVANYKDSSFGEGLVNERSYRTYNYRYVISLMYMSAAVANSVMWACASPIQPLLASTYGYDVSTVTLGVTLIYLILYIPMTFVSNYIIDEKGFRTGIVVGCLFTILGLWVRVLSKENFLLLCLGQVLGSLGAPCILNAPQKLSASWYAPSGRALSTTLLSLAAPIGVGLGFFIPSLVIQDGAAGDAAKSQINKLMVLTALGGSVMCALPVIFVRENPPTPPSAAAAKEKLSYSESMKQLKVNKNYLVFLFGASFFWGTYSCLASVMGSLIRPFGYQSSVASIFGLVVLVTGIIGSFGWGFYVGISKKYKKSLCILATLSTCMLVILLQVGPKRDVFTTGIYIGLYGFFTTPALPVIFEFCCEITFPVSEANAGGLTYMMTQALGVVASFSMAKLFLNAQTSEGAENAFKVLVALQAIGLFGFIMVKEDLRRTKYEQVGEEANIEEGSKKGSETRLLSNHSDSYY